MNSSGPLLPNLHTLHWTSMSGLSATENPSLFLHQHIQDFKIVISDWTRTKRGGMERNDFDSFFDLISSRMPNLCTLDLRLLPNQEYQAPLAKMVRLLPKLSKLVTPAFPNSSELLCSIFDSEIAEFHGGYNVDHRKMSSSSSSRPTITELSLAARISTQKLTILKLHIAFDAAAQIFQTPLVLEDVQIISGEYSSSSYNGLRNLITRIPSTCPRITNLGLKFEMYTYDDIKRIKDSEEDMLSFDDVKELLSLSEMKSFHLHLPFPLCISDEEIGYLARSWTSITSLSLCPNPVSAVLRREKFITIKSLFHLADDCHQLQDLALYMDATSSHVRNITHVEAPVFERLVNLHVGFSPISDSFSVAGIICHILLPQTKLTYGSPSYQPFLDVLPARSNANIKRWEEVKDALPGLFQVRDEATRRAEIRLQAEMERKCKVGSTVG